MSSSRRGGDVYGEGVHVAVRLEALADPGGILISDKILREVEGKVEAAFENRGAAGQKYITARACLCGSTGRLSNGDSHRVLVRTLSLYLRATSRRD